MTIRSADQVREPFSPLQSVTSIMSLLTVTHSPFSPGFYPNRALLSEICQDFTDNGGKAVMSSALILPLSLT